MGLKLIPLFKNNIQHSPIAGRSLCRKPCMEREFSFLFLCESRTLCAFISTLILWMTVVVLALHFLGEISEREAGLSLRSFAPPPLVTATWTRQVRQEWCEGCDIQGAYLPLKGQLLLSSQLWSHRNADGERPNIPIFQKKPDIQIFM